MVETSQPAASARNGSLRPVKISGLSTFVPPRVLTNHDLEKLVETSNEWILQRTGIRERHIVDPGMATSDLAKEAALGAMQQAGVSPTDIGFISARRVRVSPTRSRPACRWSPAARMITRSSSAPT